LALYGIVFFGYLSLLLLTKVGTSLGFLLDSQNPREAVLFIGLTLAGVLMLSIPLFMTVGFSLAIYMQSRLFSVTVVVSEDGIEISSKAGRYLVPKSDIIHIFGHAAGVTLVWKVADSPITFSITRSLFGAKAVERLMRRLRQFAVYTDDESEIKKVRRSLKLDHIFRKNRYELQLRRLTKSTHEKK
jgi:DNA-binding LytR/AlgR family response regulator